MPASATLVSGTAVEIPTASTPGTFFNRSSRPLRELDLLKRLAIDGPRQADAYGEHVLRIEPERHVEQPPQAPEKQARANQEHHGQRHFRDDERVARSGSACRVPAARLPAFNASCRFGRDRRSAGESPKSTPVPIETAIVNASASGVE